MAVPLGNNTGGYQWFQGWPNPRNNQATWSGETCWKPNKLQMLAPRHHCWPPISLGRVNGQPDWACWKTGSWPTEAANMDGQSRKSCYREKPWDLSLLLPALGFKHSTSWLSTPLFQGAPPLCTQPPDQYIIIIYQFHCGCCRHAIGREECGRVLLYRMPTPSTTVCCRCGGLKCPSLPSLAVWPGEWNVWHYGTTRSSAYWALVESDFL